MALICAKFGLIDIPKLKAVKQNGPFLSHSVQFRQCWNVYLLQYLRGSDDTGPTSHTISISYRYRIYIENVTSTQL